MNFYSAFNLLNSEFLESILMNFCSIIELLLFLEHILKCFDSSFT